MTWHLDRFYVEFNIELSLQKGQEVSASVEYMACMEELQCPPSVP
jgi:hypothetical protein